MLSELNEVIFFNSHLEHFHVLKHLVDADSFELLTSDCAEMVVELDRSVVQETLEHAENRVVDES